MGTETVKDKLRILYLMRLLLEETDAAHPLNAARLCEKMETRYGASCDRKTIYADIRTLQEYGLKIVQLKGRKCGYYVKSKDFDLAELKLLVDAVQSSKFITKEKTEALIKKLEKQTSIYNAAQLQRQVFIYNRIKADNAAIYANVDAIHSAIHDGRQVAFKYCEWTVRKELVRKKNGEDYIVSPWSLTWDDENYYLVGFDAQADKIKHYRVDKMQEIRVLEEERLGGELFKNFDQAAFAKKTFGMFGGEDRKLTLEGESHFAGAVIDRFGADVMMIPVREDRFRVTVTVSISPQFFGWLVGLGKGIRISWPEDVAMAYKEYLQEIVQSM